MIWAAQHQRAGVSAPVQYGPHAAAIAVYLCLGQHLPVERTAGLLAELFGTPMATGTVAAWTARAAAGLEPFTAAAVAGLAAAELVHADETGLRVAGRLHWLHVATSALFTVLVCHPKRGTEGIDAAGVLPGFTGTLVHDAFAPYARYSAATHALCNAHLLRELIAVVDSQTVHPPAGADTPAGWCWAGQIIDALLALKAVTDTGVLPDPDVLAAHRRLVVSAALGRRLGRPGAAGRGGPPPPCPGPPHPPAPGGLPAVRHRPAGALRQQSGRARHPHGENQAEGLRVPAHPRRRPGLRRDALLPGHRGQARPPALRRPHRIDQRQRLDPREIVTIGGDSMGEGRVSVPAPGRAPGAVRRCAPGPRRPRAACGCSSSTSGPGPGTPDPR